MKVTAGVTTVPASIAGGAPAAIPVAAATVVPGPSVAIPGVEPTVAQPPGSANVGYPQLHPFFGLPYAYCYFNSVMLQGASSPLMRLFCAFLNSTFMEIC